MKEKVTIDGVEYERVEQCGEKLCIAIIDNRGLMMVGYFDPDEIAVGQFTKIRDARCIIRWGTEKHLAELAVNGKTSKTTLGMKKDIYAQILAFYVCDCEVWDE